MDTSRNAPELDILEQDAEMLAVYQLDLLADVERQLRAAHQTMRHIEKLRGLKHRIGPELSNGQRENTLTSLDQEISALESHLEIEHSCCADMHATITKMRDRMAELRRSTSSPGVQSPDSSSESGAQS